MISDNNDLSFTVLDWQTSPAGDRRLLEHVMRICEGHHQDSVVTVGVSLLLDVMVGKSQDLARISTWVDGIAAALRAGAAANLAPPDSGGQSLQ